ncbi:anti-sigma-F factor Fin [Halobacillus campisalis]|uniref:Anti-sigma-F factor Fin n=1 Tax=Halobacillus campisalis TaxID=435909 RepID=A0ABW2K4T4_9BACI|nr:anti-sigma-F factor Fin [Halobacillus campisalis]
MKICYQCRKCDRQVGELEAKKLDVSQLGSDVLNDTDVQQSLLMQGGGHLTIRTICDNCLEEERFSAR